MTGKQLRNSILQWAIQGKLVPQDPNDEPASVLLERIRAEKARLVKEKKIKKDKNESIIYRGEDNSYYEKMANGTVRCIDDEIPFEIPQGWEWVKMKSIAFVTKLAGFEYTEYIAPNLKTFGIPLFKGKNIQDGEIIYEFEGYISEELSNSLERSQIRRKCLLTPYVGTIGNVGLHYKEGVFHLGSNVGKIEILNSSSTWITEEYIHLYLTSITGYNELSKHKKATAQESISIEAIRDVYVPIPPKSIQNKIVAIYERVSPLLSLYIRLKRSIDDLNSSVFDLLKKSILQEAIQGRLVPQIESEGTAEELLIDIRAEKNRLVKEGKLKKSAIANESRIFRGDDNKYYENRNGKNVCIDDEVPFIIPNSWAWVRLDDICLYIQRGKSPKYSPIKKIPVIAQKCNQWSGFQIEKAQFIEPSSLSTYGEERLLQDGDLMWNSTGLGTLGRMAIYCEKLNPYGIAVADSHVTVIRPFAGRILSQYLFAYFTSNTVQSVIEDKSDGTTKQKELSTTTVKNYLVPLPPYSEQQRIVSKIDEALASIMSR